MMSVSSPPASSARTRPRIPLRPEIHGGLYRSEKAKENLSIYIQAAKCAVNRSTIRCCTVRRVWAETTLAGIIAAEMGVNIRVTSGPAIEKAGDFGGFIDKSLRE